MKKTVSIVYTLIVVVILLAVIAYFGWDTYQSRAGRIADFESRTEQYTSTLADALAEKRDVNAEVAVAEKLMQNDPSLIAVQVYSHDDGLRISVVKSRAEEYSRRAIADSGEFDGFFARLRYSTVTRPMRVPDMAGMEAMYVSATLSGGEIRGNLLIILITVVGLFIITLVLILIRPAADTAIDDDHEAAEEHFDDFTPPPAAAPVAEDDFSLGDDDDFSLPDLDTGSDIGDEVFSESIDMDDDFELPDFDDFAADSVPAAAGMGSPLITRLESELERAASFNQDLSLLLFEPDSNAVSVIREDFNYEDLLFDLGDGKIAIIEINKDLDTALAFTEDFIRDLIGRLGNRNTRVGIASRNGRLISADRLFSEALGALHRTDGGKNIVAFRSDPEKYRAYLRSQEN